MPYVPCDGVLQCGLNPDARNLLIADLLVVLVAVAYYVYWMFAKQPRSFFASYRPTSRPEEGEFLRMSILIAAHYSRVTLSKPKSRPYLVTFGRCQEFAERHGVTLLWPARTKRQGFEGKSGYYFGIIEVDNQRPHRQDEGGGERTCGGEIPASRPQEVI